VSPLEQRVNFYQDIFRKPEVKFPARQMLMSVLGVLLVLILLASVDYVRTRSLRLQVARLDATHAQMQKVVTQLNEKLSKQVVNPALQKQAAELRQSLLGEQQFLASLQAQGDTHGQRFSAVLDGLAKTDSPALWLTQIQIRSPGPNLSLTGLTAKASALPDYLAALSGESVFDGLSFRTLSLERSEGADRYLTFNVSSEHDDKAQR